MSILFLFLLIGFAAGHPAYQHHFHNLVKSDKCLSKCMSIVHDSSLETSFLKSANISGFLLNLDTICTIIKNASECFQDCTHEANNPFALSSTNEICEKEVRSDVKALQTCLTDKGRAINKVCIDECGNYEKINDEVHKMTLEMTNIHHAGEAKKVLDKTNKACRVFKCNARCSVKEYNDKCKAISDDMDGGTMIKSLFERVLLAQRNDLEIAGLVDTLANSLPPECNYQYIPEVMFNSTKDDLSKIFIEDIKSAQKPSGQTTPVPDKVHLIKHNAHREITYSLSQLQNRLIQKQFLILEEQERNIKKEAKKLDMELSLLEQKKLAQAATDTL